MEIHFENSIQIRLLLVFLLLCMFLPGCRDNNSENYYDAGTYTLSQVFLEGEQLDLNKIYPSGGHLRLRTDGTATLILGEESCEAQWDKAEPLFRLTLGEMTGDGEKRNGIITVCFSDTDLEYVFSEATDPLVSVGDTFPGQSENVTDPLAGNWSGRFWYEDPQGEWSDYEFRSMAITGTVTREFPETSGSREIFLYNSTYSETEPIMRIEIVKENNVFHCLDGYLMSYPVSEWGLDITVTNEPKSALRDTLIIRKPGDYAHVFTQETDPAANDPVDIIRLSGNCRDQDGSFAYFIELTKE